jgi:lysophospholipase L1-like esterase
MAKAYINKGTINIGDSISAPPSSSTRWAGMLSAFVGGTNTNLAVDGATAYVGATKAATITSKRTQLMTCMIGLNDLRVRGVPAMEAIKQNFRSVVASAFLETDIAASAMRRSGTWANLTLTIGRARALGGYALYTNDVNAWVECDFYGDNVVIGAISTTPTYGLPYKDLDVVVDGNPVSTFMNQGVTDQDYALTCKVYRGFGPGKHTVRIKPNSAGWSTVVDYVGTLCEPGARPLLMVGHIPYITDWLYDPSGVTISKTIIDNANADLESIVGEFSDMGIEIVRTNDFYDADTQCSTDGIHPTLAGMQSIFEAYRAKLTLWA